MKYKHALCSLGLLLAIELLVVVPNTRAAGVLNAWTNSAGNLLWSSPLNWSSNVVPDGTYSARFETYNGPTNAPGLVNNIVAADITIQQLMYDAVAPAHHTTLINPGVTLTIVDPTGGSDILGSRSGVLPPTTIMYNSIRGTGRLVAGDVNAPILTSNIRINGAATPSGPYWTTLDMSGLDYFECGVGQIRIGATGSSGGTQGTWILARTNLIVAADVTPGLNTGLALGVTTTSGDYPSAGAVQLGQENIFRMHTLRIGGAHATNASLGGPGGGMVGASLTGAGGAMEFRSGLVNPTLSLRYVDGTSAADTLGVGDHFFMNVGAGTTNTATGVLDLTGGTVDAMVTSVVVGRSVNATGGSSTRRGDGKGTLTWTSGTISAGTVSIGSQTVNSVSSATGVVNVYSNAILFADSISIARDQGSAAGTATGTLNIAYGGSVTLTNHLRENTATITGTSAVNLTNGTLSVRGSTRVDQFTARDSVLNLDVVAGVNNANPDCDITNLTFVGAVTLNLSGSGLTLASYPVFKYKGSLGGNGFGALTLGAQPTDTIGYLFNNTANNSIDYVVTNVPAAKWTAAVNNNWDINATTNWVNSLNNAPAIYNEPAPPGDPVIFDDTPAGANHPVNVTTVVSPAVVIVNNTESYAFSGPGQISGQGNLLKSGSGTLELATSGGNNFTGSATLSGGTLLVNSTLTATAVNLQPGTTLGGTGTITGPVTIPNGATLAAGASIGNLTFSSALAMSAGSSNIFEVNSDTLVNDQVTGFGGITYGGNLIIALSGSGTALTNGAAIQLFPVPGSGMFASIEPINPAPGMAWDTNTLPSDGTLRIITIPDGDELVWTNVAGGNLLWSNPANWIRTNIGFAGSLTPNTVPTAADKLSFVTTNNGFFAATNAPGAVNNIVAADTTVASVFYTPVAPAYHTTLINPGVTLSVQDPTFPGGDFFGLRVALPDEGDSGAQVHAAIRGGGRLVVGNTNTPPPAGHYMRIMASLHPPGSYWATFDMADLNYFECSLGEIRVGSSGTSAGTHGTWRMAKTNLIVLGQTSVASGGYFGLSIGHISTAADYTAAGDVQLGQENVLQLAAMTVGGARATNHTLAGPGGGVGNASLAGVGGTMEFQSGLVNPTVKIRGIDGFSPAGSIAVGDNSAVGATTTTNAASGAFDLTGGIVDVLVTDLFVGRNNANTTSSRNGSGEGVLTWTAGTVNATTVNIGVQAANNLGTATGVINVRGNALFDVQNTINIGGDAGTAAGTANGTLNIANGGVVSVLSTIIENNVGAASGSSTINLTNGYLSVLGGITVDNLNVISGVVSNGGPATVGALRGNGTVSGPVTVLTNLAPGTSVGTLSVFNDLALDAACTSTFEVNLDTLTNDKVVGLNNLAFNGALTVTSIAGTSAVTNGTTLQLFNAANYTGAFTATNLPVLGGGWGWDTSLLGTGQLRLVTSVSTTPTNLSFAVVGNALNVSWPSTHTGWRLQAQTNSLNVGLSNNWATVAGSTTTNQVFLPLNPANAAVFYRLIYP